MVHARFSPDDPEGIRTEIAIEVLMECCWPDIDRGVGALVVAPRATL